MSDAGGASWRAAIFIVLAWVPAAGAEPSTDALLVADGGGAFTVEGGGKHVLIRATVPGLSDEERAARRRGLAFFNTAFVASPSSATLRDGLGPLFNSASCESCHNNLGRGRPPAPGDTRPVALVIQLSTRRAGGGLGPHPVYGENLNPFSVSDVPAEAEIHLTMAQRAVRYLDGTERILQRPRYRPSRLAYGPLGESALLSPRLASPLIGMGLLEWADAAEILALADPEDIDGDGISGRPNWIAQGEGHRLGRFGWKANEPDLIGQITAALVNEQGVTTSVRAEANCTQAQSACLAAPHGGEPELADVDLEAILMFMRTTPVPRRRNVEDPAIVRGARVFADLGCAGCHVPALRTVAHAQPAILASTTFYAFTDLLLHDMGEGLADGRPDHEADSSEWRTPPLWGLGHMAALGTPGGFLHDGRARTLEEAVLWHGGEANGARARFVSMSADGRADLLRFLESL